MEKMKKVYCKQCKYLESAGGAMFIFEPDSDYRCSHPDNQGGFTDTPLERHIGHTKKSPFEINKNNDCPLYEKGEFHEDYRNI